MAVKELDLVLGAEDAAAAIDACLACACARHAEHRRTPQREYG